jgi:hypothetical protein
MKPGLSSSADETRGSAQPGSACPSPYTAAYPKSFTPVWRNCPAHVEESAQWRARLQTCESAGDVMTISEDLGATFLVALILWAVLGLLMQEN